MASTLKTLQGEILVSEVESVSTEPLSTGPIGKQVSRVYVIGKTGVKYDLANNVTSVIAAKIAASAINFVAGMGHAVFDPSAVK